MEFDRRIKFVTVAFLSALIVSGIVSTQFQGGDKKETSVDSERVGFSLKGNTSDLNSLDFETDYLRVDGMYELDSPEISLESESCLRFYNYSGNVHMQEKTVKGSAEGFETCTLNASIDLTVDEKVNDMWKVSITDFGSARDFDLEVENVELTTQNFPYSVNESSANISVEDFEGKMVLYPPAGFKMLGKGRVRVGENLISRNQ